MEQYYEAIIWTRNSGGRGRHRLVFEETCKPEHIFNESFVAVESVTRDSEYELIPTSDIEMISIIKLPAGAI